MRLNVKAEFLEREDKEPVKVLEMKNTEIDVVPS